MAFQEASEPLLRKGRAEGNTSTRKVILAAGVAMCGAAGLVALASTAGAVRPTALSFKLPPYPVEHFSWKNEAPTDPPCDATGCAFRDVVFTVDNWDQLCIQHCGDIDAVLKELQNNQRGGMELASSNRGRMQNLAGLEGSEVMQGPELLDSAGVNTNSWILSEHEMPEQQPEQEQPEQDEDQNFLVKAWNNYWDSGRKLRTNGVNIDKSPVMGAELHPTDGRPMQEDGVVLDQWPWQDGARQEREGNLEHVNTNGWDGEAKFY